MSAWMYVSKLMKVMTYTNVRHFISGVLVAVEEAELVSQPSQDANFLDRVDLHRSRKENKSGDRVDPPASEGDVQILKCDGP